MKPTTCLLLLIDLLFTYHKGTAQQKYKRDTLYYYVDTAATPIADRMVTLNEEAEVAPNPYQLDTIKYLKITCACLPDGRHPAFTVSKRLHAKEIQRDILDGINFIPLPSLLEIIRREYKQEFRSKHVFIIVERQNRHYYMQRMFLMVYSDPSIDYETIKP